jgi:hypothetical protein
VIFGSPEVLCTLDDGQNSIFMTGRGTMVSANTYVLAGQAYALGEPPELVTISRFFFNDFATPRPLAFIDKRFTKASVVFFNFDKDDRMVEWGAVVAGHDVVLPLRRGK